ncbi:MULTISPECIES: Sec-independent protein translocase protein TatB [Campylobacter]|jgi:twin arginine-targeting protein translocase tatB|uniref:Sec-independent protein translocase protein TatB n=1 Tax=Campylobacter TaxID=194 RepID=UPI000F07D978|nr:MULTISPECIES: Sec-independent protein translocase protein TatB [Campylobacter]
MFGMSLPEIIVIAVIAVLFLGPDKLPSAMVEIAKFFKTVKKTVNDAKSSFDQEIKIQELKEDAKKYKESIAKTTETVRKKLTFEELDELKKGVNDVASGITDGLNDVKKSVEAVKNPGEAVKNAVLGDNEKKEA